MRKLEVSSGNERGAENGWWRFRGSLESTLIGSESSVISAILSDSASGKLAAFYFCLT